MWILLLGAILLVGCTESGAEEKKLAEMDALKIKVLLLERSLIEARLQAGQCKSAMDYQEKAKALDKAVESAAKASGVDVKEGWQPDLEKKLWMKK